MNDKEQARILALCLDAMAAGESVAACLARYPEQSAELAPMLLSAGEVGRLDRYDLNASARARARARLRQAQAVHNGARPTRGWWPFGSSPATARAVLGLAVAMVCLVLSGGLVAASQPGDLAYGARVIAERVPAWVVPGVEAQSEVELGVAMRRLAELRASLDRSPEQLDPRTVLALLASDGRAAELAAGLPAREREAISGRLAEQARSLEQLGHAARQPQDAEQLLRAAVRAGQAANRAARGILPPPAQALPTAFAGPTETATPDRQRTVTSSPSPSQMPTDTPTATATRTPRPAGTRVTPAAPTSATAAPPGSAVSTRKAQPPIGPVRTGAPGNASTPQPTNPTPGPAGPAPTSPGPGPESTAPGPAPTSPGPGPGPGPTSPGLPPTAPGPGPEPTSSGAGPAPASSGPGPKATPRGRG